MKLKEAILLLLHAYNCKPITSTLHLHFMLVYLSKNMKVDIEK